MAQNELTVLWYQSSGGFTRRATSLAANTNIFRGSLAISVNGVATSLVSGTALNALSTTIAGADANGGLVFRSNQANVRVTTHGGTSQALGVFVSFANAGFVDIIIQQSTDGGGVVTSTAANVANAIRQHGLADELVHVVTTGTGAGLTVTTGTTAINQLVLLGAADETYINLTGSAIPRNMGFKMGKLRTVGLTGDVPVATNIGGLVTLVDDSYTIAATLDPMAFTARLIDIDFATVPYVNLCEGE